MRKLHIILILLILAVILSAGCVQTPHVPSAAEEDIRYTIGFFDKPTLFYNTSLGSGPSYFLVWEVDLENATGFVKAERRHTTENRVPIFSLEPGTTGIVPMSITAPDERDVTAFVGDYTEFPKGYSAILGSGEIFIPAGETVTVPLTLSLAEDAADNDRNPTLFCIGIQDEAWTGQWILLLNSEDPYIPDID